MVHMFLGLPDPHPDPLVRDTDPDPYKNFMIETLLGINSILLILGLEKLILSRKECYPPVPVLTDFLYSC
jgi:hypothetical protein